MKASPIQYSICVTCLLLLLAKLRDWWQTLGTPASLPASLPAPMPVSVAVATQVAPSPVVASQATAPEVVSQATPPEDLPEDETFELADGEMDGGYDEFMPAEEAAPFVAAEPVHPVIAAPAPVHAAVQAPVPPAVAQPPAPVQAPPVRGAFEARGALSMQISPGESPSEAASDLHRQLTELAARELAAARLRAKSLLLNAETQARGVLEEAEKAAAQQVAKQPTSTRPAALELNEARRQGARESHAIGLRKGEMEALGRIEQVFAQIEHLLDAAPLPGSGTGGRR